MLEHSTTTHDRPIQGHNRMAFYAFRFRAVALSVGILLLMLAPLPVTVYAQTPMPTPDAQELEWLRQLTQYAQQTAQSDASTVNTTVVLLAVAVVLVLILIFLGMRSLAQPFFKLLSNLTERVEDVEKAREDERKQSEREVAELRTKQAELQLKQAQNLDQMAASQLRLAEMLETKGEAKTGRDNAITAINRHTDAAVQGAVTELNNAAQKIEDAAKTIEKVVTVEDLRGELAPILDVLRGVTKQLSIFAHKGDTGELNPRVVPEPPAANVTPLDLPAPPAEDKPA